MNRRSWHRSVGRMALVMSVLMCGTPFGPRANAQGNGAAPGGETVELEPLRCWWKTGSNAVHVAERFTLALTGAALESSRITFVPDLTYPEPTSLRLLPFEP